MIRLVPFLLAPLLLAGCDRPATAPRTPEPAAHQGFDNAAASRSIMQPKVIAESEPVAAPSPTPPPPTGATVLFARGASLDDAARAAIDALLAAPTLPSDAQWILRGSSDTDGSRAANLATSRRRAQAVRAYLIGKGVTADQITVYALGDGRPVAPNVTLDGDDDPAGRARNRRVDIEILSSAANASPPTPTPTPAATPTPADTPIPTAS